MGVTRMKRLISHKILSIYRDNSNRATLNVSLGAAAWLAWPGQDGNNTRTFLLIIAAFIILLFVAVAVILPLALHATHRSSQKKKTPAVPPPLPEQPQQKDIPTEPGFPQVQVDDTTSTQPSMRSIGAENQPQTLPVSGQRPEAIGWQIAGLTDTGLRRELNEDNLVMLEGETPYGLYVVADGMGGHDAGEIASQLTVEAIRQYFANHPLPEADLPDMWLKDAAMAANHAVLSQQADRAENHKMGSTLVMALVTAGEAYVANVGDSRAYRLNQAGIEQISIDHSLVERLVQIGQLTREEARTHRQKNVIYNTVGDKPDMEVGLYKIDLQPGDRLLLCSDGLSGMITDEEILDLNRRYPDPATACQMMIEAAKRAGGYDNITAIVVQLD
jgi:PPM family protein phosphatase